MTPGELNLAVKAYGERLRLEQRMAAASNYNLACLIRTAVWGKRMPKFEQVVGSDKPKAKKNMTDDEMYAVVKALNRAFGGTEK